MPSHSQRVKLLDARLIAPFTLAVGFSNGTERVFDGKDDLRYPNYFWRCHPSSVNQLHCQLSGVVGLLAHIQHFDTQHTALRIKIQHHARTDFVAFRHNAST